jgi:hypothetical protein|tara:strand:+ start:938 stop:1318 length:381 start_codon:yes stop_codon:yes gene_type:complete
MIRLLPLAILLNFSLYAENCITYQNMNSILLDGELITVKGTRYWDHGEEITYYIFRLDKETCFNDGEGPIETNEVQVILNKKQLMNLDQLLSRKIQMKIDDFLWGGTQQWKRSIGVPKARFIINPS